jgi:uncharacterized membrane protein YfcA
MIKQLLVGILILIVAIAMTMVGKGGGNFYVVILALADIPMHEAAATGQFILFAASAAALIFFQTQKVVSWLLAVLLVGLTSLSALGGGYFSHYFSGFTLKIIFAVMLILAGAVMLIPFEEKNDSADRKHFGVIHLRSGQESLRINLLAALPVTVLTGFAAGMVGVSGGSFLVPLMVLACGVPIHTAVGTASSLIAATALMGFIGHAAQGDFNPSWAIPLAFVTIAGGVIGGRYALRTKPKNLKQLFAFTNWLAAGFMVVNALST